MTSHETFESSRLHDARLFAATLPSVPEARENFREDCAQLVALFTGHILFIALRFAQLIYPSFFQDAPHHGDILVVEPYRRLGEIVLF